MTVFNPGLRVAGTLDMIVDLPGLAIGRAGRFVPGAGVRPCVDVKTGKHLAVTWPEQIGAYRRCPECLPTAAAEIGPMPRDRLRARCCTCGPSIRAATGSC